MTTETWQFFHGSKPISRPLLVDPNAWEPFCIGEPRVLGHVAAVADLERCQDPAAPDVHRLE
jgi:hypothetical protein